MPPALSKKKIIEILEKDFPDPGLFKINHIKNNHKNIINTLFKNPTKIESYDYTTVDLRIKLYLNYRNDNSEMESENAEIIVKVFGNTLANIMKIKQLETDASTDHLTGCYNRRSFHNLITHNIENSHRYKRDLSIIILDIDYFKEINDTYGHQSGDEVLKAVSEATQSFIRRGDYLARYGGDEFVIILPETKLNVGVKIAHRLKTKIEQLRIKTSDNQRIHLSSSYGVGALKPGFNSEGLIEEADSMLYKAKSSGRNCVMPKPVEFDLNEEQGTVISCSNI